MVSPLGFIQCRCVVLNWNWGSPRLTSTYSLSVFSLCIQPQLNLIFLCYGWARLSRWLLLFYLCPWLLPHFLVELGWQRQCTCAYLRSNTEKVVWFILSQTRSARLSLMWLVFALKRQISPTCNRSWFNSRVPVQFVFVQPRLGSPFNLFLSNHYWHLFFRWGSRRHPPRTNGG